MHTGDEDRTRRKRHRSETPRRVDLEGKERQVGWGGLLASSLRKSLVDFG